MLERLFKRTEAGPAELSVILLQRVVEFYSTEHLNSIMQKAWRQRFDPITFCAVKLSESHDARLRSFGERYSLSHVNAPLRPRDYGKLELPYWGFHRAQTILRYESAPVADPVERNKMLSWMGLLCAELMGKDTAGLFFPSEKVFVRTSLSLVVRLRSGTPFQCAELTSLVTKG